MIRGRRHDEACAPATAFSSVGQLAPTNRDALVVFRTRAVGLLHVLSSAVPWAPASSAMDVVDWEARPGGADRRGGDRRREAGESRRAGPGADRWAWGHDRGRDLRVEGGAARPGGLAGPARARHLRRHGEQGAVYRAGAVPREADHADGLLRADHAAVLDMVDFLREHDLSLEAVVTHTAAPAGGGAGLRPRGAGERLARPSSSWE